MDTLLVWFVFLVPYGVVSRGGGSWSFGLINLIPDMFLSALVVVMHRNSVVVSGVNMLIANFGCCTEFCWKRSLSSLELLCRLVGDVHRASTFHFRDSRPRFKAACVRSTVDRKRYKEHRLMVKLCVFMSHWRVRHM
jgi:hypothetical protein